MDEAPNDNSLNIPWPVTHGSDTIQDVEAEATLLLDEVEKHSQDYITALGFTDRDVNNLKQQMFKRAGPQQDGSMFDIAHASPIHVDIEGKRFYLLAKTTHVGSDFYPYNPHADHMENLVMAMSEFPSLNRSYGKGTVFITAVSEEWHQKILEGIHASQYGSLGENLFQGAVAKKPNFLGALLSRVTGRK